MKKCPKCGNTEFIITPHVTQSWLVDGNGNYLETVTECEEVTYTPDDDDIWTCANKECNWNGSGRACNSNFEDEPAMTEEEYQEIKHAGAVMCRFCEADHCTNCQVTELLDDAYNEAVDAGLITED